MSTAQVPIRAPGPRRRRWLARPSTRAGLRAEKVSLLALALILVDLPLAAAGAYDWSQAVRIAVLGPMSIATMLCAIVAAVLAVRALWRGDRSLVLAWPLFLGAAVLMFVVGEIAVPH